jgi:GDP-L-fucose synthase
MNIDKNSKIFVTGHLGLVGSAVCRSLKRNEYKNIITVSKLDLNLLDTEKVSKFLKKERPDVVISCAGKVGGIHANNILRGQFIYENIQMQTNIIHQSYLHNVKKLIFLGSSCIYPRDCPQPIKEEYLLSSQLEYTNSSYAIAKISGIEMCKAYKKQYGCNFISVMPCNIYGPNDYFNDEYGHVLPSLLHRFHISKKLKKDITIWGNGSSYREFIHSDDVSDAIVFLMENYNEEDIINIGTGVEISIKEMVEKISEIVGFEGRIIFDTNKPNGTPRKVLDVSKINNIGWKSKIRFDEGLKDVYRWVCDNFENIRV